MIDSIDGHTVRTDLLTGGHVLDAGCRDFLFSMYALARGCKVIALDPDPEVCDPVMQNCTFIPVALAGTAGECDFALTDVVEARHLVSANQNRQNAPHISVPVTTLNDIMIAHDIKMWDCVKMDIEGSEYEILRNWPGPIAKQITVEFHDHVEKRPPELYEEILGRLGQWYTVEKLYAGDTLWVLKEHRSGVLIGLPWWRS